MSLFDFGSFVWGGGVVAVLILVFKLIVVKPIEIHPLQSLGKAIGKVINGEVLKEVGEIKTDLEEVKTNQARFEKKSDRKDADIHRSRILRFADDVRRGQKFSDEYYVQILDDIKTYEDYCESDKDYKNSRAVSSIEVIKVAYEKHKADNTFLK